MTTYHLSLFEKYTMPSFALFNSQYMPGICWDFLSQQNLKVDEYARHIAVASDKIYKIITDQETGLGCSALQQAIAVLDALHYGLLQSHTWITFLLYYSF